MDSKSTEYEAEHALHHVDKHNKYTEHAKRPASKGAN